MGDNVALIDFVSGFAAETVSCLLWVPIDVIKERQQVQSTMRTTSYKNTFNAISTIMSQEGLRGLYKVAFISLPNKRIPLIFALHHHQNSNL